MGGGGNDLVAFIFFPFQLTENSCWHQSYENLQLYLMEHAKDKYGNGCIMWATASTKACSLYILCNALDTEVLPESQECMFFRIFYG